VGGDFTRLGGRAQMSIGRLNGDGTLDTSFTAEANDLVATMVLQADGKILVGGSFTMLNGTNCNRLGRLNADGTLDHSFNPEPNDFVAALAIQNDGKVLAGGDFTVLGGQDRLRIGRLTGGSPAMESLTVRSNGMHLRWSRTGSAPEIEEVTFETSLDGTNYTLIGIATRSIMGWEQTLAAPFADMLYVRAQGHVTAGYGAGSRGIAQMVAQFWRLPPPFISLAEISSEGKFRFGFANPHHATFSVSASANVADPFPSWQKIGIALPMDGEWYEFADPNPPNHSQRFYRLHRP
jgi:hypothetical protein